MGVDGAVKRAHGGVGALHLTSAVEHGSSAMVPLLSISGRSEGEIRDEELGGALPLISFRPPKSKATQEEAVFRRANLKGFYEAASPLAAGSVALAPATVAAGVTP